MRVGVDVGGTHLRVEAFDDDWKSVERLKIRVRDDMSPAGVAGQIKSALEGFSGIESLGVGLAGQMSADGTMVYNAPNLGWRNVAFQAELSQLLGLSSDRLAVVNDLNAVLWGEYVAGAAQGATDVLAAWVGSGVGGAIIADGRLVIGAGGKAGELGHVKVVVGGRRCGCGQDGCVEAYAGGVHLEKQVYALAAEHGLPGFEDVNAIDLALVDSQYRDVAVWTELWERNTSYLALAIANAVTVLNPSLLLFGGGILENLENFRDLTLRKVVPLVLDAAREDLRIAFGELGDGAGTLGAAALSLQP